MTLATLAHSLNADSAANGVDAAVNYEALRAIGPWDDRNYQLTASDLALLASNEAQIREPIPAFYRVQLRRQMAGMRTTGPTQYPRKALNYYRRDHLGFLIDGQVYRKVRWTGHSYEVVQDSMLSIGEVLRRLLLGSEALVNGPHAGAAESAVSISPVDDDLVVAGVNEFGQGMYWSDDGGHSWQQAADLQGNECCDPTMAWSSDGQFVYAATLGGARNVWFYRSDDNGQTWDSLADLTPGDPRREISGANPTLSDKEYLHVDHAPTSPFRDRIYLTFQENFVLHFAVSTDFGNSFQVLNHSNEPDGIGSDISSDSLGRVYHFWPSVSDREIRMARSDDGGMSFNASILVAATNASFGIPLPSMETREAFVYVSTDTDLTGGDFHDRVYVTWTDTTERDRNDPARNHAIVRVAWSDDGGDNWSDSVAHPLGDSDIVDRYHPWLAVAPSGDVLVGFYDTRQSPDRTGVDFYLARSTDGGETWLPARRLTGETSPNIPDDFEFGDYNGLDVGQNGAIAIFTDNRVDPSDSNAFDQVDVYSARVSLGDLFVDGFELCALVEPRCRNRPQARSQGR